MKFQTSAFIKNVSVPRDFRGEGWWRRGGFEDRNTRRAGYTDSMYTSVRVAWNKFEIRFDFFFVCTEEGIYVCVYVCVRVYEGEVCFVRTWFVRISCGG